MFRHGMGRIKKAAGERHEASLVCNTLHEDLYSGN